MRRKLDQKRYGTLEDFANDLRLVYGNARKFNALAPDILALVDKVEKIWLKQWPILLKSGRGPGGAGTGASTSWKKPALNALEQLKAADTYVQSS